MVQLIRMVCSFFFLAGVLGLHSVLELDCTLTWPGQKFWRLKGNWVDFSRTLDNSCNSP